MSAVKLRLTPEEALARNERQARRARRALAAFTERLTRSLRLPQLTAWLTRRLDRRPSG